ncbi:MAG: T9SS type A sorting domain-containing protein [Flavobacteriia bacterium]|nr:T9SS type A sorting domain-containing protein [Flavobacteriia bacterium]
MGALHLDFYSLHIYPYADYRGNWNDPQSRARLQAELYWFGQECPMPWIIGEIGYSANDDEEPPHTGIGPQYHQYPYMDGTEAEQADFVQWSLGLTRQYGGSGWSWWYFQEFRWWDYYYPNNTSDAIGPAYKHGDLMHGIYYALLKPGDANNDYYDKLAVPVVQNYSPAPMPETPAPPPANYYNWDNLPGDVLTTGTVVDDASGVPIPNANVRYWFAAEDDPWTQPDNPNHDDYGSSHFDVTDGNGQFTIYDEPALQGFYDPYVDNLIVVGLGSNSIQFGGWYGTPIPASYTFSLHRNPFVYSGRLHGLELTSSTAEDPHRFAAWTDLQAQDVTVHPSPVPPETQPIEMVARRSVYLQPGFHAEAGSEAHVHLEETFPDCVDESFQYPTLVLGPPAPPEHQLKSTPVAPKLELRFQAGNRPRIFPNPAQAEVWVELPAADPSILELYDGLGRLAGRWSASGQSITIDVARMAVGPYRLRIIQRGTETSHTFIKQP